MRKYFLFEGTSSRQEFWAVVLINFAIWWALYFAGFATSFSYIIDEGAFAVSIFVSTGVIAWVGIMWWVLYFAGFALFVSNIIDGGVFTILMPVLAGVSAWVGISNVVRRTRDTGLNLWWIIAFIFTPFAAIILGCLPTERKRSKKEESS